MNLFGLRYTCNSPKRWLFSRLFFFFDKETPSHDILDLSICETIKQRQPNQSHVFATGWHLCDFDVDGNLTLAANCQLCIVECFYSSLKAAWN